MSYRKILLTVALVAGTFVAAGAEDSPPAGGKSARGPGGPAAHAPAMREIGDKEKAELLEFLRQRVPDRYAALEELKTANPSGYNRTLAAMWRLYLRWKDAPPEVQAAAVRLTEWHVKMWKALEQYRSAADAQKPPLLTEMRDLLSRQLDDEHVVNRYRLVVLEKRIEELRGELKQQAENRDQTIQERLDRIIQAPATHEPGKSPGKRQPASAPAESGD